jgi:hypothetical protein
VFIFGYENNVLLATISIELLQKLLFNPRGVVKKFTNSIKKIQCRVATSERHAADMPMSNASRTVIDPKKAPADAGFGKNQEERRGAAGINSLRRRLISICILPTSDVGTGLWPPIK